MTEFREGKCKRHGVTKFYVSGRTCVLCWTQRNKLKNNTPEHRAYNVEYAKNNHVAANSPATKADAGQAGEHLVASDLLGRGLKVTKLLNTNSPHDLHVQVAEGWKTVQVKLGSVNRMTGRIIATHRGRTVSDIYAAVDLRGKRIRYIAKSGPLPAELQDG